jgi:hypothetical protein
MDLDGIGYARALQAERAAILANVAPRHRAKLRGWAPPTVEPKTHRITVDLKTGEREVSVVKPRRKKRRKAPKAADAAIYVARGLPRIPRQEAIKLIVAVGSEWDITYYALTSACRTDRTARPRFACFLLLAERLCFSLPRIGRLMGNRDHTTVLHGIRRARHLMDHDPDWRRRYDAVVAKLEKGGRPWGAA